ncbi:helix-turn-helix transcriptional regulator [Paenibacillus rigui]|uniref:Transcriptional regulator n=1 Tax=Paenibacillus rigui TaxID=554312 RepID=A0A229UGC8_9BACL|nr:helix-turn-helix transcriptional regulator [Paenibacillus rigui]OXM82400.1 transcriptional regulator [Paenibacillus rigui]
MEHSDSERLQELARFLRTRRARLAPEQVGLSACGRRRTPGLRRGEVAQLSGMSVDWYTWLEQARDIKVSPQVLESIARALQLDVNERKHLFVLALRQLPTDSSTNESVVNPMLQTFLDLQGANPAYVTDHRLNVVGWNLAACLVYGPYPEMTPRERNSIWRTFTSPYVRELLQEHWESHARHRLAHFRANYARFAGDAWWMQFIEELHEASTHFKAWWPQHDVLDRPEGRKINYHPVAGTLVFDQISFQTTGSPDLTITVNMPSGDSDTASKMDTLLRSSKKDSPC